MVTGSFDKSVAFWSREGEDWVEQNRISGVWDELVYSVAIDSACMRVAVGCRDKSIYILDREGNPVGMLPEAHSSIVSSV